MNTKILRPYNEVFWHHQEIKPCKPLTKNVKTDVVIVGGGFAGLSAAQSFHNKGYKVVLLEKYYCGSGASGKSSGFITPDSELNLSYFNYKFGEQKGKKLWEFVLSGVKFIKDNIKNYELECNYQSEDSFIVANSKDAFERLKLEDNVRKKLNYTSTIFHKTNVHEVLGSHKYFGAVRYPGTFGINAYTYCQGMKKILEDLGVQIFEESPVIKIHKNSVDTINAKVEADYIIVCIDKFLPELNENLGKLIYNAQTFLMLSNPLKNEDLKKMFPEKNLMVWDTDLIYQYFRIINNRLLVGGSSLLSIFWPYEQYNNKFVFNKLTQYIKHKFPNLDINFEYFWPGMIGVSKDLMPIADNNDTISNYFISGATGLPWAAALGNYSALRLSENNKEFDEFFSAQRKFPVNNLIQNILRKTISFSISNLAVIMKQDSLT